MHIPPATASIVENEDPDRVSMRRNSRVPKNMAISRITRRKILFRITKMTVADTSTDPVMKRGKSSDLSKSSLSLLVIVQSLKEMLPAKIWPQYRSHPEFCVECLP